MSDYICPFCNFTVKETDLTCPSCSKLLPIAAAAIEASIKSFVENQGEYIAPEILTPRLGDYLLEKGDIVAGDIQDALKYQKKQKAEHRTVLLGQALIELGKLEAAQLDQAVTEQIFALQNALTQSNNLLETRVKDRTAELEEALGRLTELNTLKNNFISNISHELRTPLAHMVGYIDLLADGSFGEINDRQTNALDVLKRAYDRLYGLIDNLIQFTLIYQGEFSLILNPANLYDVVETSIYRYQSAASRRKIELINEIEIGLPMTVIDREKIGWVFDSLLDNGIKFNKEGGVVKIKAEVTKDNNLNVSVIDSGIGVEAEEIDNLFQPFHQLDSSPTRRYGGTGVGLALAQKIAEAHGTTIHVESKIGQGSRFSFYLPIKKS